MSATSPSPNSPVATTNSPPPQPSSPPPEPPNSPPPQPSSPPPEPPSAPPPQPSSPPPETPSAPPSQPSSPSPPPSPLPEPPPSQPSSPPPELPSPPPPQPTSPPPPTATSRPQSPPTASPPPPSADPPTSSPPPPSPTISPPPQPSAPPPTSPPPPSPTISPPPQPSAPPPTSSPPPPVTPQTPPPPRNTSPPPQPPQTNPPQTSPPPPRPPPPSPPSDPIENPPPPRNSAPPIPSHSPPPPSDSPPTSSPPPPVIVSPPSPLPVAPPRTTRTNDSATNMPPPETAVRTSGGGSSIGPGATTAIAVAMALLLLGIFGIAACFVCRRKKRSSRQNEDHTLPTSLGPTPKSDSSSLNVQVHSNKTASGGLGNSRSWFTYEELNKATNGFSAMNLLGEGGFGSVYKGNLVDGREIAVKQLKIGGGQGEREFRSEVEIISRIHHRHLVSLVGFCISDEKRLLVYDYIPNNTLYFHLHGNDRPVMDWATRVKIAVGAARGIAYLHEDCQPRIIHRDIKSSNILLDINFEARVSDFGLAKLAMDMNTHVSTRVMGTFGYMAPEYASSGKLTDKSDVYSYGVVLLELITGRKPVDTSQPLGEESLVEWARPLLNHALDTEKFGEIADSRLEGKYIDSEMFRLIEAAAACVRHSSANRPKMGQVVRAFDNISSSDLTNGMKVGHSEIFNSAQQSAEIRLFQRMAFGSQDYSTDFFSQTQNGLSEVSRQEHSREDFFSQTQNLGSEVGGKEN